jgi:DNA repair exonuclease SbcCD ATPase subunit
MPAQGSTQHAHVVSRPDAAGDHSAPQSKASQRVVSVSPHLSASSATAEIDDQQLLDAGCAMIESLRAIIEQAGSLSQKLVKLAANASESEAQAAQAVVHLQERLRLSAQMLKAFQSQIGRIDHSLEQLKAQERRAEAADAKNQQRLIETQATVDAALREFSQRLDDMVHAASEKVNQMLNERAALAAARVSSSNEPPSKAAPPQTDLHQLAETMREVAQRLAALTETSAAHGVVEEKPQTVPSAVSPPNADRPEIHVAPPLRFHTWASRA